MKKLQETRICIIYIFADNVYSVILRRQIVLCQHLILSQILIAGFDAGVIMMQEPQDGISSFYCCINSRTKIQTNWYVLF